MAYVAFVVEAPPPDDGFRRGMVAHLARLDANIPDGAALFLGSSSIQGLAVADVAANAANLGIGGETIPELKQRMSGYTSLPRARLVVLAIGYNDLCCQPPDRALAAYPALLARIPASTPLVISGVQEGAENPSPAATRTFNAGLRALCAARAPCAFVDIAALLDTPARRDRYAADGVHLSAAGYAAWKQALRQAIASLGASLGTPLDPPATRAGG